MSTESKSSSHGSNFMGFLFLLFLTLKLTNVIDWSWWWVTAPLWGGIAILLAAFLIILIGAAIVAIFSK